jgi:gamma-glutamylcyclotransferase (GGCT)/AIG2-like uncharacterized protein YtfP
MIYFAYGMNTNNKQMAQRCPAAICLGVAVLPDWKFRFAGCADIVPSPGGEVVGVLWNITEECLDALDTLEGYPTFYTSSELLVEWDGTTVYAEAYHMTPGNRDNLPSQGYLDMVLEGYKQNGVPTEQVFQSLKQLDRQAEFMYN